MSGWETTGERIGRELGGKIGRKLGEWLGQKLDRERSSPERGTDEISTTDDETPSETPNSRDELEEMSYRELQKLAMDVGVKANTKREQMVEDLADEFGIGGEG
ncbi:hypothetical protein [Haladaptatus salinisoli]|uniref:hypothetical protein n=1 Tax=Haladaptatus salinisoli TaxID=2884876 RepID=UPI001D0AA44D|nr:hypothetical protein [Haladaptatus salinisoli]